MPNKIANRNEKRNNENNKKKTAEHFDFKENIS